MVQRVLIIDDEVALARNIKDYLEADGFEARACGDGETGIAAFDELPTDVVVLDLNLPGMDGLAVLELLREHDAPTRVIIITAYGNGQTASCGTPRRGVRLSCQAAGTKRPSSYRRARDAGVGGRWRTRP